MCILPPGTNWADRRKNAEFAAYFGGAAAGGASLGRTVGKRQRRKFLLFFEFCQKRNIKILDSIYLKRAKAFKNFFTKTMTNLFTEEAVFVISK